MFLNYFSMTIAWEKQIQLTKRRFGWNCKTYEKLQACMSPCLLGASRSTPEVCSPGMVERPCQSAQSAPPGSRPGEEGGPCPRVPDEGC